MSNQQAPSRPWFRLASLARPAPQAPTPTPEPTPAPPRPAATVPPAFSPSQSPPTAVSSVPTSPAAVGRASQPSSPSYRKPTTSSSVPSNSPVKNVPTAVAPTSSPPKTATTTTSMASSPTRKPASSVPSPQASPIKSPKIKPPTAPTPSPLTLPPPQLKAQAGVEPKIPVEAEQKTVVVQKTIDKPREWLFGAPQKDVGETSNPSIPLNEPYNNGETMEKGHGKDDVGTRVITIAGANKGAFMELIGSPHNNGFRGSPHRLGKMVDSSRTGSDYQIYSSSDGEGDGKMNNNNNRTSKTKPMNAFMNSNVQGVNNSILYNSSCTHHDPGVHLSLRRKPAAGAGGFHVKERINGYNS